MKNKLAMLIGGVIVVVLLAYMFLFQVRYDQVAVLTTFDKATDHSIKREPGLYWRLPWPIQKVQVYPKLVQMSQSRLEQIQTADSKSVIVTAYLTWKIDNPLGFFIRLEDIQTAKDKLSPLLSSQISATIGDHQMDELVNTDRRRVKLAQIEQRVHDGLNKELSKLGYGIQVQHVGIRRLLLPQESTAKVFETMRKTRDRLASIARSSGSAQAKTITSQAQAHRDLILNFAKQHAQAIRTLGDQEAAQYYSAFREDESLAIFLRRIETLKSVLPHNTTFVLDADQLSLRDLIGSTAGITSPTSASGDEPQPDPHVSSTASTSSTVTQNRSDKANANPPATGGQGGASP